jgi:hypothetical protein
MDDLPVLDDHGDLPQGTQVGQRVSVDDKQIGSLTGLESSDSIGDAHGRCRTARRGRDDL